MPRIAMAPLLLFLAKLAAGSSQSGEQFVRNDTVFEDGDTVRESQLGSGGIPVVKDLVDFFRRLERLVPVFDHTTKTITMEHDGKTREARVYVPDSVKGKAAPLVISFHAWGSNARLQQALDLHDVSAKKNGYIIAYPQGYSTAKLGIIPLSFIPGGLTFNSGGCCPRACSVIHNGGDVPDDVGFAKALAHYISKKMNRVDFSRIYATGMSNGGFMAHRLACEAGSDFLAAQAPVAGVISNKFWDDHAPISKQWTTQKMVPKFLSRKWPAIFKCNPSRAVPTMHFHGGLDPLVPVKGGFGIPGVGGFGYFNPVETTISTWLRVNKAPSDFKNMPLIYSHLGTQCWSSGHDSNNVTYCLVRDMTHSWPGCGGMTPVLSGSGMDATSASWEFFKRHRCETCADQALRESESSQIV